MGTVVGDKRLRDLSVTRHAQERYRERIDPAETRVPKAVCRLVREGREPTPEEVAAKIKGQRDEYIRQLQRGYDAYAERIVAALRRLDAIPEGIDPMGHPIEQTVGTCVSTLRARTRRLEAECAALRVRQFPASPAPSEVQAR